MSENTEMRNGALKPEIQNATGVVKKSSFWNKLFKFLLYGGWILILIVVVAIVIAVSAATN